eukprot:s3034_g18.t1
MAFLLTPFCRCSNWGEAALEDGDADSVTRAVGDGKLKLPQAEEVAEFQDDDKPTAEDKESDHSTTATATGTQDLPDSHPQQAEDPKEAMPLQEAPVAEVGAPPKPGAEGKEEKEDKEEKKVRRPPEPLTTLEEQDFNDRGVSSLDESKKFSYTIGNDYKCTLSGWTHTRPYACGFIRNKPGTAKAVVSGLDPDVAYLWKVYQVAKLYGSANGLTVNGEPQSSTVASSSTEATASGKVLADKNGKTLAALGTFPSEGVFFSIYVFFFCSPFSPWPRPRRDV